jgi:integrase|uniref:Integrase n=1 Tax=Siphoviridae sp. ctGuJ10 TaxID=2825418 RepID=A0A8S5PSS8_9CAUD|nr:MAG TPA: Integrase [Siphoviridae sp. ctGuJ10]
MTLDELVLEYEETMKYTIKAGSLATYRSSYDFYSKKYFGNMQIEDINNNVVKNWWNKILNSKTRTGKDYSIKTINSYIKSSISVYLSYAEHMGYIKRNPLKSIPKYKCPDKVPQTYENFWELSDFKYFLNFVDIEIYRDLFYIIFFTGMRIGEVIAMTWEDIDFFNKKLSINKNLRYAYQKGYITSSPKSKCSVRKIELSDMCMEILNKIRLDQLKDNNYSIHDYVFGGKKFLRYCTIRKYFKKYLYKSGVKEISIHGLRHSHASMLINAGVSDNLIANRLGHSIFTLHDTYAHIYSTSKKDFYPILNKLENNFKEIQYQNNSKEELYN